MNAASILIADDESNIRMLVRAALESDGYRVREAGNGREALEEMAREMPELTVLDLNMPGLDGISVLEQMKEKGWDQQSRVVVLTAYGSIVKAVRATQLGAIDFLEKPTTPVELRQTVRSVLSEPQLDAPPGAAMDIQADYEEALSRIRTALRLPDYSSAGE
ncbi:MAG TPA: response regulator, partial [Tepidisphaeraceae bacterium]|nr:response regulator [Tepidisphaeraceae bacterium]